MTLVPARLGDNQSQVGVDHALLGRQIAALDSLRQLDLFTRCQQRVDPSPAEKQSQRVGSGRGAVLGVQLRPMDSPSPRLPGGCRLGAGTPALAGLFDLIGVVLAAVAGRDLTTIIKTVQFGCSY